MTEPDFNVNALNQAHNQAQVNYDEAQHLIGWPLQVNFPALLTKNDPRAIRASLSLIKKINREDLLAWYKSWVQGDTLTMTVTGDIDVDVVIREVGAVFGSLPTLISKEETSPKPRPITFAKGIHRTFHVDTKDKASRIIIRYPLDIKKENKYLLPLTQNLIQEALRLTLREEERAIYAPQVSFSTNAQGLMQNTLDILLSGDRSKATFIKNRALNVVTALAQKGVTAAQFELAKTTLGDMLKRQDENLGFWLDYLSSNNRHLSELSHPDARPALLEKITIKDMNAYLKKYFLPSNTSTAIIHGTPKKLQDKK
ncbi:MAG: Peptidase M16 inactive domain protein [bacterium ADurb.BinA186]|nr:MAG: Peptidase M16 inactive domain protein [bacterium ADurb.BinA186]